MLIKDVRKLSSLERFKYWIEERHSVYLKKEHGKSKPWTDDEILQSFYFTNPYRENDKVTKWFRERVREPLSLDDSVLMATVIFRWFNKPETGEVLIGTSKSGSFGLLTRWNEQRAVRVLNKLWDNGRNPVFTGAFMIKAGNGPRGSKIPTVCSCITDVWNHRKYLIGVCKNDCTLCDTWKALKCFRGLGGFMSYEIVTDLRHTALLSEAKDVDTWCNMGPGARRGMNRLLGRPLNKSINRERWVVETQKLLAQTREELCGMPHLEMREIEHSLCEYDKYERGLFGQGKLKRRYSGR